jgi:hypothetical protein
MSVYGPTEAGNKDAFLQEIGDIQAGVGGPWLINGDFNMIYRAEDKNNSRSTAAKWVVFVTCSVT